MSKKNNFYSKELKLKAINMYLDHNLPTSLILKELKIRSDTQIRSWVKLFKEKGETAFDEETRGKYRGENKGRPKTRFDSIEEELKYLRMENEYLKKLNALTK